MQKIFLENFVPCGLKLNLLNQTNLYQMIFVSVLDANSFANPATVGDERPQPSMFEGKLKGYQLKVNIAFNYNIFNSQFF